MKKTMSLRIAALLLALTIFGGFTARAATTFGFNYYPGGYTCNILWNSNWTTANKEMVKSDMDAMVSLSAGVLRLFIWSGDSGFMVDQNGGGASWQTWYPECLAHISEFVGFAKDRGLQVIVVFGNNNLTDGPGNGLTWWQMAYGNSDAGFSLFLNDTGTWIDSFINAIQNGGNGSAVLFYDYQNEVYSGVNRMGWYLSTNYDWRVVPAGKKGCSIGFVPSDSTFLYNSLGAGRPLNFVDFHSYPDSSMNSNIESCYDQVKTRWPNSTVTLGEYGSGPGSTEAHQQTLVTNLCSRSATKGIPYNEHWWFYGGAPGTVGAETAWSNYDTAGVSLRDVYGGMSSQRNLCPNPDMEQVSGGIPTGWQVGGNVAFTFSAGGPSSVDASTNNYYARVRTTTGGGMIWLVSPGFSVTGNGSNKIYTNFHFRSSMSNVNLGVNEYDANWNTIVQSSGPSYTPSGWSFNNSYLRRVGTYSRVLNANTRHILLSFCASTGSGTTYLDVDSVSAYVH